MKVAYIVPFLYNWNSYSTVRSGFKTLLKKGIEAELFIKKYNKSYNPDQIWLMGAGVKLTKKEFEDIKVPVIAFGLSDPNLYNKEHMQNCDLYCTNNLDMYMLLKKKRLTYYYPTCCDKSYHKNLNLKKTNEILFIGTGNHPFLLFRNTIINELRAKNIKIKVFGRGWDKHPDTYNFIEGKQLIEEINKSKILLDLIDEKTSLSHRIFEGSACGTPVVTSYRADTGALFKMFEEIIPYKDFSELKLILNYYLDNPEKLREIGKKAQKRCYEEHDINIRIHQLLNFIRKNIRNK